MKLFNFILFMALSFYSFSVKAQALPDFTDLVEELMPTVVSITSEIDLPLNETDIIDIEPNKTTSSGSGFIISSDGLVVTNKHVIDNANKIKISTNDNLIYEGIVVGTDDKTDLALVKIAVKGEWNFVKLGDSDNIRVGEWAIAIGNPFGLGSTVTKGIISAKSRDIDSGNYDNFIQTDTPINQGNSGGPLFNMKGEVIGINTAIFSTTGKDMGINFAIPINLAKWVINQLKENKEVKRGWIGIGIQPTTILVPGKTKDSLGAELDINFEKFVVVISTLTENGPAQKAGIKVGDIISTFDGIKIDNTKNLSRMIAETQIGKKSRLEIERENKNVIIDVEIGEMPKENNDKKSDIILEETPENFINEIGISFDKAEGTNGLIVSNVNPNFDAYKKGISKGDVVTKIDKKNIFSIDDVKRHINDAKMENNRPVLLQVQNNDETHLVAVELKR